MIVYLKPIALPLLLIIAVNIIAIVFRSVPSEVAEEAELTSWPAMEASDGSPDVRQIVLRGGQWGAPAARSEEQGGEVGSAGAGDDKVAALLNSHIQRRLTGIVHRGEWVLLFALPSQSNDAADHAQPLLELRSGDLLPDTSWLIGTISADRVQLTQEGHGSIIVPLYPIAESVTEP